MCGRFVNLNKIYKLNKIFEINESENVENGISYNIAPSQSTIIITNSKFFKIENAHWGMKFIDKNSDTELAKKLKINGILRLAVPDFEKAIEWYNDTKKIEDVIGLISGGQKTEFDYHKMIYDRKFLTKVLKICGFDDVKEWEWRQTEHGQFDDYSQSYLPHMDKENGMLMSLNLQAIKIQNPEKDNLNPGQSPWVKK